MDPSGHDEVGYFPRGSSKLRRVHEERVVGLLYGQRALCVGAVKSPNYVGTSEHARNKRTPFRRLAHTAEMFETVFFGSCEEADRVLAIVDRMHERVVGELFGMPRFAAPATYGDFRAWYERRLAGPDLHLTAEAR